MGADHINASLDHLYGLLERARGAIGEGDVVEAMSELRQLSLSAGNLAYLIESQPFRIDEILNAAASRCPRSNLLPGGAGVSCGHDGLRFGTREFDDLGGDAA